MARSVSYPSDTHTVCFRDGTDDSFSEFDWDYFVDWVRATCQVYWPSMCEVDQWAGREDRILVQNNHAQIGVSEYCGLVAVWLRPRPDNDNQQLATNWCDQIQKKFQKHFDELRLVGRFSNGEAVYERIQ